MQICYLNATTHLSTSTVSGSFGRTISRPTALYEIQEHMKNLAQQPTENLDTYFQYTLTLHRKLIKNTVDLLKTKINNKAQRKREGQRRRRNPGNDADD